MTPYEFYSNVELFKHSQNKSDELAHYGTKGQRWGTRHWQNYDGTFNQAGKERYFGTGKSKNGVSDYLKFKKTATDEPAKEFGDFPGVKGLKRAFNNLKKFEFGSSEGESEDYKEWYKKFHEEEMKRFNNWNNVGKKVKLDGGDVRTIYDSNEDLYNENARQLILKNADKIHKMDKALSKGDMKTFNKIRDTFDDDYEKDLAEIFIEDKGKLKIQQDEIKRLQNEFDSDKNIKGKIEVQNYYDDYDGSDFISIYPSDMLKDPKKLEIFKQSASNLKDNYNKHNEIITDKLVDMYYNAFKNTYGYEDHPLTKSEFKNTFNNVSGTLYPNGILEAYMESKEYGDHGTSYYFNYDVLNKTLSYIEAD